jgi:hypothetical protein
MRSPIVVDGTVQIEYEITDAEPVLLVRKQGQGHVLHHCVIDRRIDLKTMANELLADLGAWAILASNGFTRAPIG